ncbi:MAG: hypothetical protein IJT21_08005 [Synergistaceae bacterium]|nr:hypothetical protein [Synergistaceae bacterium]
MADSVVDVFMLRLTGAANDAQPAPVVKKVFAFDFAFADKLFRRENIIYLIEQKIRDDHDSTKKRGQYNNFREKFLSLAEIYPDCEIKAVMWFIDDSLKKNQKFYNEQAASEKFYRVNVYILYGIELFTKIFNRLDIWQEICGHLTRNKNERNNEILFALRRLKRENFSLFNKLLNSPEYNQLRAELFPTKINLNRA